MHRLVTEHRPDVVLAGSPRCVGVYDVASQAGIPWLCWAHGELEVADEDDFDPSIRNRVLADVVRADRVVSCARHHGEWLGRKGVANVTTIPNGIDVAKFSPAPKDGMLMGHLDLNPEHLVIGHISRLDKYKRPLDIIESAVDVARVEPTIQYLVVGESSEFPALRKVCEAKGIAGRFRFVGRQDYSSMPEILRAMDIVVMPSSIECMSRVYLETQASGRVLLASDIAAAREVVVDGQTGVLFAAGDVDDISAKIIDLAGDSKRRALIGKRARAHAVAMHNIQSIVSRFEELLSEVVNAKERRAKTPLCEV